jgi:hypothetical protein
MATAIVMPKQGNTVEKNASSLSAGRSRSAYSVAVDDVLCEVETDRAHPGGAEHMVAGTLLADALCSGRRSSG